MSRIATPQDHPDDISGLNFRYRDPIEVLIAEGTHFLRDRLSAVAGDIEVWSEVPDLTSDANQEPGAVPSDSLDAPLMLERSPEPGTGGCDDLFASHIFLRIAQAQIA